MIIAYARTSMIDQTAASEGQLEELEGVKCLAILSEFRASFLRL